jgi:hypothetical protein
MRQREKGGEKKMACLFCLFFYAKKIKTNRGYKEEEVEKVWRGKEKIHWANRLEQKLCLVCLDYV